MNNRISSGSRIRHTPPKSASAGLRRWSRSYPVLAGLAVTGAALAVSAVANHQLAKRAERRNPPSGQFVEVDGVRLHFVERGEGRPLVLLHGNGSMIEDFALSGLIDLAARNHRVIVFDRPGYGHSSRPGGTVWTADAQAAVIRAALARLGIDPSLVLGHSWGASVAMAMALRYPEEVGGLILVSGYYYPTARLDVVMLSAPAIPLIGDVIRHAVAPVASRLMWPLLTRKIFSPAPVPGKFDGFPMEMAVRPSQIHAEASESAMMIPIAAAACARYAELNMPVAIVVGAGDRIVDPERQSYRLHQDIPQSTLHRVPGSGHMVHQTQPEAVMAAINDVEMRVP